MLTPRPRTFVRLPRNIVDPANRPLTYWSLAKRESSSFGLTMLAAEKLSWLAKSATSQL